tara:strand:- start:240 stop:779 length:540 start_codon:yes stop_codon:yes gene_type:complete
MISLPRSLKRLSATEILMALAAIAVIWALCSYSGSKMMDGMSVPQQQASAGSAISSSSVSAAAPLGSTSHASVSGISTPAGLPSSCSKKSIDDPSSLLPRDQNSKWAELNPQGSGDLENVNLLTAGSLTGLNTVGSSLRNANLQLRSEPANPQMNVGPWNNTTMEPDVRARPFEIGSGL